MKIGTANAQWPEIEEMQKAVSQAGADTAGGKKAGSLLPQDTVDISPEGKRKSTALQSAIAAEGDGAGDPDVDAGGSGQAVGETSTSASEAGQTTGEADQTASEAGASVGEAGQSGGGAGDGGGITGGDSGTATTVTVAELKEQLQSKKNSIKARQADLEAAKAQAEGDLLKQGEVKRLQQSLSTLEKEAAKLQSAIYSS
ncbi:hypothetical protein [Nitratidesulfovibrio sp.]|uniref:hypothetical protein n=1 Tax=Nitratidesulfovibrio sp. TaxID=2802297 RepID=UPI00333F9671